MGDSMDDIPIPLILERRQAEQRLPKVEPDVNAQKTAR